MKYIHSIRFIVILGTALLLGACHWEQDMAPTATYDGKANCTIAQLIAYHDIGAADSYDTIPAGTVITGIVTSSDEHGNCYKYINIEDETGAIQIKINSSVLYHKYAVGQRVYVECDGLVIGDYRKLPQLGLWANGGMESIPSNKASSYIFCDGLPKSFEPVITLTTVPASAADLPDAYFNRLVRIEGATFPDGGNATFSESNTATSHDLNLDGGGTLILRTSNYADFAGETLPVGTGTIVGLLTRYNNYIQLVIRDLNDLQGFTVPQHFQTIYQTNFNSNPLDNDWSQTASGSEWQYMSNSSFSGFYLNAANTTTDSWIISPAISLVNATSPKLAFSHRAPAGGNNTTMKCYYTTHYTGDVNTTTWTEIPIQNFSTAMIDFAYELPATAQSNNFRFAFRYTGSGSAWYLKNIAVSALVNQ